MAFPLTDKQVILANTDREFTFKIMNTSSSTLAMSDLAHRGITPSGANIIRVFWSQATTGDQHIEMTRGTLGVDAVELLDLHGVGDFNFEASGIELSSRNTLPLNVVATGGNGHHFTVIVAMRKF